MIDDIQDIFGANFAVLDAPRRPPLPSLDLLAYVLLDAVEILAGRGTCVTEDERRETRHWVRQRRNDHLCSFERICELLWLDASRLRPALLALQPGTDIRPDWKHRRTQPRLTVERCREILALATTPRAPAVEATAAA